MPNVYDKVTSHIKPDWLKIRLPEGEGYSIVSRIAKEHKLHTICESGKCPNKSECWGNRTATFMIMGDICTRSCRFCATETGRGVPLDREEPARVARSIALMELRHAVITSVTRDDLADGGAHHWAETVAEAKKQNPEATIELLIPDMGGDRSLIDIILDSDPDIAGHNIETVRRLTPRIRSCAQYDTSLKTIAHIASQGKAIAKSGIMVGMGETEEEVIETLADLAAAGCRIVTIGQYLRPTLGHWPVEQYVTPDKFQWYAQMAAGMGFSYVASAPMVRSSYKAGEALEECRKKGI